MRDISRPQTDHDRAPITPWRDNSPPLTFAAFVNDVRVITVCDDGVARTRARRMTRAGIAISLSIACTYASAADLPSKDCAPPVNGRPSICRLDVAGAIPAPALSRVYIGHGGSYPAQWASLPDAGFAACRSRADGVGHKVREQVLTNCLHQVRIREAAIARRCPCRVR
jgi:hypothetical protein